MKGLHFRSNCVTLKKWANTGLFFLYLRLFYIGSKSMLWFQSANGWCHKQPLCHCQTNFFLASVRRHILLKFGLLGLTTKGLVFVLMTEIKDSTSNILWKRNNLCLLAATVQWICLRLTSCAPWFESRLSTSCMRWFI